VDALDDRISNLLFRGWRLLLIRGLAAIAFGLLTWGRPAISLTALVLLFAAYALVDGVLAIWAAVAGHGEEEYWWLLLLGGFISVGVGVLALTHPDLTALALLFYIAIWAVATGLLEIIAAIRIRKEVHGEWRLILAGLFSVAFGAFLMARPDAGALTVLWLIAAYAVAFGIVLVLLAFKARSFGRQLASS
jgi:uncharacterized membrane protein HdeD (DUF308 family)